MKNYCGFTLIEVLITMVILAVGLLGLAGLEVTALRNTQDAYYRGQATQLAYDLADKIRSNVPAADAGSFIDALPNGTSNANCHSTTGCSAAAMAGHDVSVWQQDIARLLPSGVGDLTLADGIYTIEITWDDDRDGDDDNNVNFLMSFRL